MAGWCVSMAFLGHFHHFLATKQVEVGIGSGALHASLDAVAQAGDELPML